MTIRTNEVIISEIEALLESHVKPAVAGHGGNIEFISYDNGRLMLQLGGACSGCAGSTMTLKMGVENMMKHYIPEIEIVEAQDDPFSTVDPFYTDPFMFDTWDMIDVEDVTDDSDN